MKYEMVFGDDGLFFDAQKDCEMVGNGHHKVENGKIMVWNFSEKYWAESHTNTITISAMRRIIAEPKRWTAEDQKAGRLPEVGSLVMVEEVETKNNIFEFAGVCAGSKRFAVKDIADGFLYFYSKEMVAPIESPQEKAARLRKEWCSDALSSCSILSGMQKYELKRLGVYIEGIYDALLSGDIPVPSAPELHKWALANI